MAVVMLTTYENPTYLARALAGGAAGYLLKGIGREELLQALRAVAHGEALLTPQALGCSLRGPAGWAPQPIAPAAAAWDDPDLLAPLTAREREVLRLLARGLSNREIAAVLSIAEATARTHVENIMGKLGVSDRVQAAVWAARHGLAEPDSGPTAR
jgi:DNA-binding NarL/FixJ family response regulator